jgi:hypothetical protein
VDDSILVISGDPQSILNHLQQQHYTNSVWRGMMNIVLDILVWILQR